MNISENQATREEVKTGLALYPYGLLSITCITKSNSHLKLQHEVSEYFKKYRCFLNTLETSLECHCEDEEEGEQKLERSVVEAYLYQPRFISLLGQSDLRIDVLVDDFDLLNSLPNFKYAAKQKSTIHFIPNLSEEVGREIFLEQELYFLKGNDSNLERAKGEGLLIQSKPFQFQIFCKLDAFVFAEFGLELIYLLFIRFCEQFKELKKGSLKVLPLINFEWHELGFIVYTHDIIGSEKITSIILDFRLSDVLKMHSQRNELVERCKISFARVQLLQVCKEMMDESLQEKEFNNYQLLRLSCEGLPEWDAFIKLDKVAMESKVRECVTENIFFTVFLKKPDRGVEFDAMYDWEAILERIHPVLSTRTLFGFPSELFLFLLIPKSEKMGDTAFLKEYRKGVPDDAKLNDVECEAEFVRTVGRLISEKFGENDKQFEATVDLKILSYKLFDSDVFRDRDREKLYTSYGSHEIRKVFRSKNFVKLLRNIAHFHKILGSSFYGTTVTQLYHKSVYKSSERGLKKKRKADGYKKIHLSDFADYKMADEVHRILSAVPFSNNLHYDLKYIFGFYNTTIQDTYLFENTIELYPVILKLFNFIKLIPSVLKSNPGKRREIEKGFSTFVHSFRSSIEKNYYNTKSDLAPFSFNVDMYSNMQKFIWIASGVQRSLMSIYYHNDFNAVMYRACVLSKGETNEILQRHMLVPFIYFSVYHVSKPESLNMLFHEIGHFFTYSDWCDDLLETECITSENKKTLLKYLGGSGVFALGEEHKDKNGIEEGGGNRKNEEDEKNNDEIYDELIPDMFYLLIDCCGDPNSFLKKFLLHLFSTVIYPDLIAQTSHSSKEMTEANLLHNHLLRFTALLWATGKIDPLENPDQSMQTLYEYFSGCNLLNFKLDANRLDSDSAVHRPFAAYCSRRFAEAMIEKVSMKLDSQVIEAFNGVYKYVSKFFSESKLVDQKNQESIVKMLKKGTTPFYRHKIAHFHSFKFTTQLLRTMLDSVLADLTGNPFPFLKQEKQEPRHPQRGMGPDLINWDIPKTSSLVIHPTFGLTIRTGKARRDSFLRRSATILGLMDISIQSRADLIQEAIWTKRMS